MSVAVSMRLLPRRKASRSIRIDEACSRLGHERRTKRLTECTCGARRATTFLVKSSSLHRLRVAPWLVASSLLGGLVTSCGGAPTPSSPKAEAPLEVGKGGPAARASSTPFAAEDDALIPITRDDAVLGERTAFVTIVVFSDFECPFCARVESTFERLRAEYGVENLRFVFKHNPLGFHRNARVAAEIGQGVLALAGNEAFWRYHSTAFRLQKSISRESLLAWASEAGASTIELEEGLKSQKWAQKVDADIELSKRLDVNGTPVAFINGVTLTGAQPFERFKELVDIELGKAKARVAGGVARDRVYATQVIANFKAPRDNGRESDRDDEPSDTKTVYKVPVGTAPVRGPATALVTIVEFSDYECPFCKRASETLERVRKEYGDKVRVVWRDMPLPFHSRAEPAAHFARAARVQRGDAGFWDVHDRLFASQPKLEISDFERIAREAKLDVAKAMAAVQAKSFKSGIEDDLDVADDFGAAGTPHFFINGRRFVGAQSFESFKSILDEEIAKADALLKSGVSRAALYETLIKDGERPAEPEKRAIAPAPTNAPYVGAPNAKLVIQQVSDFECPFCKRVESTVDELVKAYPGKIKVVWRDKPLPMHSNAALAAEAAREAYAQKGNEGFAKMRKLLFENQRALSRSDLEAYAKALRLDLVKFTKALDSRTHKAVVDADDLATKNAGVQGTPAFFIGPYFVSGAQPLRKFRKVVELALRAPEGARSASFENDLEIEDVVVGVGAAPQGGDRGQENGAKTLLGCAGPCTTKAKSPPETCLYDDERFVPALRSSWDRNEPVEIAVFRY